jgi:hypothetical protein
MSTGVITHTIEYHPYGLPMGTVRGFMSVLICSFFWIFLLLPEPSAVTAPLAHFFLLTLVFLSFASHPGRSSDEERSPFLPWLMRVLFVGGSIAVISYVAYKYPSRLTERLTPNSDEIRQWPVLLATLSGGFAFGLFTRFILGRNSDIFQTLRAWIGVVTMLFLLFETILQFLILPNFGNRDPNDTRIWEAVVVAATAAYFGMRA